MFIGLSGIMNLACHATWLAKLPCIAKVHLIGCEQSVLVGLGRIQDTIGGGQNSARKLTEINFLAIPGTPKVACVH
jgi:hypothetical protein